MARLSTESSALSARFIELHLGSNTFGRSAENDWQVNHPTVSARHCIIELGAAGLKLKDCGSTNGTFVNDEPVSEVVLAAGQTLRFGDVQLLVDNAEVCIAIPKFEVPMPAPPVVLPSGAMVCPKHPEAAVTYRCNHCHAVMCDACVHVMKRRGGKPLVLCSHCSQPVKALTAPARRKRTFFEYLRTTVKMPFMGANRTRE